MHKFICSFLIIIVSPTVFAQNLSLLWGKNFTDAHNPNLYFSVHKVISDNNGNLIIGGNAPNLFIGVYKTDTAGNVLWQLTHKHYTTANTTHQFTDITTDANGNVYVAYSPYDSAQFGVSRLCVMKISSSGNILWDKMYTGQHGDAAYPTTIKVDANGNVYTTGIGVDSTNTDNAMVTIKMSPSGALLWEKIIDGNAVDNGNTTSAGMDMALDNNGNLYVVGGLANFDSAHHFDLVLAKYAPSGTLLWSKEVNEDIGTRNQYGQRVLLDNAGNVIVCAYTDSYYQNAYQDLLLIKYNPSGTLLWKKVYAENVDVKFNDMLLDHQNNIVVAGGRKPFFGYQGFASMILKFNTQNGDTLWTFSDMTTDWLPASITTDGTGRIYAWGVAAFNLPARTLFVYALESNGNVFATVPYANNSIMIEQPQNIIYNNKNLYGGAYALNNTTGVYNGILCKYALRGMVTDVRETAEVQIKLYPNPSAATLQVESGERFDYIIITDMLGRVVFTQSKIQNLNSTIDVSELAEATFFIHIKTTTGKTAVKSFVKQ